MILGSLCQNLPAYLLRRKETIFINVDDVFTDKVKRVQERVENVPLHTYAPSSKPLVSQDDHNMLMRLSYPVTLYGEKGCMADAQFSIIDGIESYIHRYRPRSFEKYLLDKAGYEAKFRVNNPKSYDMHTRISPDNNGALSLNDLFTQNQLVREAEIFWDKLDPSCSIITAIFAGALAKKLQCDARRQDGQMSAQIAEGKKHTEIFSEKDVGKIEGDPPECNVVPIKDLFKLPNEVPEADLDSSPDLSYEDSFVYWMDRNPDALAKALERFSRVSLSHSLNKLYILTGQEESFRLPNTSNGTLERTPKAQDFYAFFDIEKNRSYNAFIDDKVTVYGMAALSMCPALMPYAYEFFAGEKHKDMFVAHNVFAFQRYGLYDSNTIYDMMSITGENFKENRLHWESHQYGRNFNICAQICAVDYLYKRRAMGMQDTYLGDMNRSVDPNEATRHALDYAQRAIMGVLQNTDTGNSPGRIPKDSAYPSVAIEETLTQFRLHDPTVLGFLDFDKLSNTEKQSYLFLTQPASIRAAECYIDIDNRKAEEIRESIIQSIPGLLHEMQKSLYFMPKVVSQLVTGCDYNQAIRQPPTNKDTDNYDFYPDL